MGNKTPDRAADHAQALAALALEMREAAMEWCDPRGRSVPIRIGISSGPVVAGVVGTRKFFYDVWGDAVNVAARMETTGSSGKIQVSQDIYESLRDEFVLKSAARSRLKARAGCRLGFGWPASRSPPWNSRKLRPAN